MKDRPVDCSSFVITFVARFGVKIDRRCEIVASRSRRAGVAAPARRLRSGEFERLRLVHQPLEPPTVIEEIFTVGMPTPTGTYWPPLPQV